MCYGDRVIRIVYDGPVGWRRNHSDNGLLIASTIDATTTMDISVLFPTV